MSRSAKTVRIAPSVVLKNPVHFLAFGLGSGLSPVAPGTFGTLVGIPLFWAMSGLPAWQFGAVCLLLFGMFSALCHRSAALLGVHDHSGIVLDEVLGYVIAAAPLLWGGITPTGLLAAFVLFRIFDVLKPWPIRWLDQHVHGGIGIMLDDALAALISAAVLALAMYLGWL